MEYVVVVFAAGIHYGNAFHQFTQRDAAPVIANADAYPFQLDVNALAGAHDIFVNAVVDDFLDQDINPVVRMRTVAKPPDIHTRTQPDMLQRTQCLYLVLIVQNCIFGAHNM